MAQPLFTEIKITMLSHKNLNEITSKYMIDCALLIYYYAIIDIQ